MTPQETDDRLRELLGEDVLLGVFRDPLMLIEECRKRGVFMRIDSWNKAHEHEYDVASIVPDDGRYRHYDKKCTYADLPQTIKRAAVAGLEAVR